MLWAAWVIKGGRAADDHFIEGGKHDFHKESHLQDLSAL